VVLQGAQVTLVNGLAAPVSRRPSALGLFARIARHLIIFMPRWWPEGTCGTGHNSFGLALGQILVQVGIGMAPNRSDMRDAAPVLAGIMTGSQLDATSGNVH